MSSNSQNNRREGFLLLVGNLIGSFGLFLCYTGVVVIFEGMEGRPSILVLAVAMMLFAVIIGLLLSVNRDNEAGDKDE